MLPRVCFEEQAILFTEMGKPEEEAGWEEGSVVCVGPVQLEMTADTHLETSRRQQSYWEVFGVERDIRGSAAERWSLKPWDDLDSADIGDRAARGGALGHTDTLWVSPGEGAQTGG